jgi:hypothetical protein
MTADLQRPPFGVREVTDPTGTKWWFYLSTNLGPVWTNGQRSLNWEQMVTEAGAVAVRAQDDHIVVFTVGETWDIVQYDDGWAVRPLSAGTQVGSERYPSDHLAVDWVLAQVVEQRDS